MLVCWPPFWFPTTYCPVLWWFWHSTYHHEWQPFTNQYENMILIQVPSWENMLQKSMLDCSMCSINTSVYYFRGPVIMVSQLRTWFIQNHHFISVFTVDWCVWIPSLHYLTCWKNVCAWFLPDFLFAHSSNSSVYSY